MEGISSYFFTRLTGSLIIKVTACWEADRRILIIVRYMLNVWQTLWTTLYNYSEWSLTICKISMTFKDHVIPTCIHQVRRLRDSGLLFRVGHKHRRSQKFVLGADNRLKRRRPCKASRSRRRRRQRGKGMGRGCPPPQPTRRSGERRELPQRGPGRSPGRQRILGIFQGLKAF